MSTSYASVDDLTTDEVTTETRDVDLGKGRVVKVRGLTRFELIVNGKGTDDALIIERRNVATCMVEPPMTVQQVEVWQKSSRADALAKVTVAIRDLSGLGEGAGKSDVSSDGDD